MLTDICTYSPNPHTQLNNPKMTQCTDKKEVKEEKCRQNKMNKMLVDDDDICNAFTFK